MTPKSFFTIILKIFGLFFLKEIIVSIPQLFSNLLYFVNENALMNGLSTLFFSLLILLFYGVVCWNLLFNTPKILNALKLQHGFEQEEFSLVISQQNILTIALIVIAGIILVNEIPNFSRIIFSYFEMARLTNMPSNNDYSLIMFSGIKIILGLLLIGERKRIVDFIGKKQEFEPHE